MLLVGLGRLRVSNTVYACRSDLPRGLCADKAIQANDLAILIALGGHVKLGNLWWKGAIQGQIAKPTESH